jgi:transposase
MKRNPHFITTGRKVRDMCAESPRERLLHRLHSVALVAYGLSASEVGRIFDDSPRAVAYWVKRFKQGGVAGLEEEARPGRPSKLNPAQMKRLQTFVRRSKANSKPVKAETLADYILKEFRVVLTIGQCWRILKRLKA